MNTAAALEATDHKVGLKTALKRLKSQKSVSKSIVESSRSFDANEVLMEGWMKKHKVRKSADTRWCVLTQTELKYFKRKSDKTPKKTIDLGVAMIKHSNLEEFSFEVHSPLLLDTKDNPQGRMYFACKDEATLQKWLSALRVSDAMTEMVHAIAGKVENKTYVNLEARRVLVRKPNNLGQTPLHLLAKHEPRKFDEADGKKQPAGKEARRRVSTAHIIQRQDTKSVEQPSARIVTVASYLIECGSDVNGKDKDGNTPVKFAVQSKHLELASALVKVGADVTIKGNDGVGAIDLLSTTDVESVCSVAKVNLSDLPPLREAPPKVAGCTYLSLSPARLDFLELECEQVYLKTTVYARSKVGGVSVAEEAQVIPVVLGIQV